ncbi:SMP-30/gluconolactonase/LRE family protein [Arthrobacter sp. I2-34]|uniref:SMP-30/gluconolactonase/LRE family protein n=1 Tax=Arthrobacter hankyongi TaxID=2904801 RepID=A0ABS9L4R8_9MICC|nr:SMP-30/gluconolactonase/LRE family protein [Arthrobacter hankyongi]MCG2621676.1 SMP-30/gluconolactonase/LRE family protein [Arthrobacter hankyongi]
MSQLIQATASRNLSSPARLAGLVAAGALLLTSCAAPDASDTSPSPSAVSTTPAPTIVLPGATSAEGIAAAEGDTFFAGDLVAGDIFRGDLGDRRAERFIDVPSGRMAVGMKADQAHSLLAVAGGTTGQGYFYDTGSGKTIATLQLAKAKESFINDVVLTPAGAWFTNSRKGELYVVPISDDGKPGEARTVKLTGPAAEVRDGFNLNGIAATDDGRTLIVAHTNNQAVYTVDPETGASKKISGLDLPYVDGLVLQDRQLWAVQNFKNQVSRIRLDADLGSGAVEQVITSGQFQTPTTAALIGAKLLVVNAKFDTGNPPTAKTYEVVIVDAE